MLQGEWQKLDFPTPLEYLDVLYKPEVYFATLLSPIKISGYWQPEYE